MFFVLCVLSLETEREHVLCFSVNTRFIVWVVVVDRLKLTLTIALISSANESGKVKLRI